MHLKQVKATCQLVLIVTLKSSPPIWEEIGEEPALGDPHMAAENLWMRTALLTGRIPPQIQSIKKAKQKLVLYLEFVRSYSIFYLEWKAMLKIE